MKTNYYRSLFLAGFALLVSQAANADLLVGFHSFAAPGNDVTQTSVIATGITNVSAKFTGNENVSSFYNTGGAASLTYGNSAISFVGNGNDGYANIGEGSDDDLTFSFKDKTAGTINLQDFYFDASKTGGAVLGVLVKIGSTVEPENLTLSSVSSPSLGSSYAGYALSLAGLTLTNGQTLSVILTDTASDGSTVNIDNVAITSLSAVPEPASLCALGCVLASGFVLRRRSR